MSHPTAHPAHADVHHHGGHHGHDDHHHDEHAHGSLKSYMIGFVLAIVLTVIPFWFVMGNVFSNSATAGVAILALAAVQMVVHMVYFLHMNTKSEGGWNMLALVFTVLIVAIMLSGSLWVMYHMNHNMMPGMHSGSVSTM